MFIQAVRTQFFQGQLWTISKKSAIKKLVVLDTIYLPEERLIDKIEQISIAHLLGDAIIRIHEKRPLSPLFCIEKRFNLSLEVDRTLAGFLFLLGRFL